MTSGCATASAGRCSAAEAGRHVRWRPPTTIPSSRSGSRARYGTEIVGNCWDGETPTLPSSRRTSSDANPPGGGSSVRRSAVRRAAVTTTSHNSPFRSTPPCADNAHYVKLEPPLLLVRTGKLSCCGRRPEQRVVQRAIPSTNSLPGFAPGPRRPVSPGLSPRRRRTDHFRGRSAANRLQICREKRNP